MVVLQVHSINAPQQRMNFTCISSNWLFPKRGTIMGLHQVPKQGTDRSFKRNNLRGADVKLCEPTPSQRQQNIRRYTLTLYITSSEAATDRKPALGFPASQVKKLRGSVSRLPAKVAARHPYVASCSLASVQRCTAESPLSSVQ